jgi:hypothetical protein
MNKERKTGYSPEEEAAIIDMIRVADQRHDSMQLSILITKHVLNRFGRLDFASLERMFRRNSLTVALLAIPSTIALASIPPGFKIVDPNDITKLRPFSISVATYGINEDLLLELQDAGMDYDPATNLSNLSQTGMPVIGRDSDLLMRRNARMN